MTGCDYRKDAVRNVLLEDIKAGSLSCHVSRYDDAYFYQICFEYNKIH